MSRKALVPIQLPGNPSGVLEATPKQYVDGLVGKFTFVQDATPTTTVVGATWYKTSTGQSFIWYDGFWIGYAPNNDMAAAGAAYVMGAQASIPTGGAWTDFTWSTTYSRNSVLTVGSAGITITKPGLYNVSMLVGINSPLISTSTYLHVLAMVGAAELLETVTTYAGSYGFGSGSAIANVTSVPALVKLSGSNTGSGVAGLRSTTKLSVMEIL